MPVAPSFDDLLAQGQSESQSRRPDLTFYAGSIALAQMHGSGAMADAVIRMVAQAFRETFIDGARGDALTALVDDHLNIQRDPATEAQVTLRFTRPSTGGSEPGGTILAGTTCATEFDADGNEYQFTLDANLVWAVGELGPKDAAATAVDTGPDGNVAINTIVRILDQPSFDSTFVVTNPAVAAGGNVEESDEELRRRARAFWQALRRGTLGALEYGALLVGTVRVASATEDAEGWARVRVTDADGGSTAEMVSDAEGELEGWRAAGVEIPVTGGQALTVDLAISLTVRVGFSTAAHAPELIAATEGRMEKLVAGETMYLDSIIAAIINVYPDDIVDVTFDSITVGGVPAAIDDIEPADNEVIRPGTTTIT